MHQNSIRNKHFLNFKFHLMYFILICLEIKNYCLRPYVGFHEFPEARICTIVRRRNTESPGVQREICFPYRVHKKRLHQ